MNIVIFYHQEGFGGLLSIVSWIGKANFLTKYYFVSILNPFQFEKSFISILVGWLLFFILKKDQNDITMLEFSASDQTNRSLG